ncbi:DNA-binding protein [Shewanella donghaensis]|uniref:DNA-binding protein n=1 Tax=Shewanella donghaensis TaxID=238836 RepID=UPI0011828879|nr:DNA-binding protein [Shewanella donghaensis]
MKTWLICIDDTDDICTKGTGEIAEEIATKLAAASAENTGLRSTRYVTRHQLLVHPDIPYTSHNSAMCFQIDSSLDFFQIKDICVTHLKQESATIADPGLAILDLEAEFDIRKLIEFGQQTKIEVKTKQQAYELAKAQGVDLTEHGGTGQGVIGAIAGIGLRLSGQDGRVKGHIKLGQKTDGSDELLMSVEQFIAQTGLQAVITTEGEILAPHDQLTLKGKIKAVYIQFQFALLVSNESGCWCNATKQQLKSY